MSRSCMLIAMVLLIGCHGSGKLAPQEIRCLGINPDEWLDNVMSHELAEPVLLDIDKLPEGLTENDYEQISGLLSRIPLIEKRITSIAVAWPRCACAVAVRVPGSIVYFVKTRTGWTYSTAALSTEL